MNMRDHLSSNHRLKQGGILAGLMSGSNAVRAMIAAAVILPVIPVAFSWQQAVQPAGTQKASSTKVANESATSQSPSEPLNQPDRPADMGDNQAESSTSTNNGQSSTKLKVNGQDVTVPQNGTVTKVVPNSDGGATQVNASNYSNSSGSSTSQTVTNVQTSSGSSSSSISQSSTITNNSQ